MNPMLRTLAHRALSLSLAVGISGSVAGCSGDATNANNGTGGAGGMGGTGGGGNDVKCDSDFAPTDPTALLDDMEDGDGLVTQTAGRNGSWWLSTDMTSGTTTPPANQAVPPERITGGRCSSKLAIRVTGEGFTDWGAVLSAGMAYTTEAQSVDLSAYQGVKFWARVGEVNNANIRVQFQDVNTMPEGHICDITSGTPEACYNGFGTALAPLDTQWRLYQIRFATLTQRDFGHRADALDIAHIYGLEWNIDANSVFDLWIDDVWFY
jgi:hypothetical protein